MSRDGKNGSGLASGTATKGTGSHHAHGFSTYPKPRTLEEIGALRRSGHRNVLIEASAGTGKTFVLEHMVVDLLLGDGSDGGLEMSQILVVTFTEQAAAELRSRLGKKLAALLERCDAPGAQAVSGWTRSAKPATVRRAAPSATATAQLSLFDRAAWGATPSESNLWILDGRARQRLEAAIDALPSATITTIHGFCHQLLTSFAFTSGRLLSQQLTYGRALFDRTFRALLRERWTTNESIAAYLEAYVLRGHRMANLADGLHEVYLLSKRCGSASPWAQPFVEGKLRQAWLDVCAALAETNVDVLAQQGKWKGPQRKAAASRIDAILQTIHRVAGMAGGATDGSPRTARLDANLVLALEQLDDEDKPDELIGYLRKLLGQTPGGEKLDRALADLEAVKTDLTSVLMERMLPTLAAELDRTKRNRGLFDFDDMISAAAELVTGQHGPQVVASLRRRYSAALIDEFQDTDDVQWDLFRKVFLDSPNHHLFAIGDPKQAIYGFRGADVGTYLKARDHIAAQPALQPTSFAEDIMAIEPMLPGAGADKFPAILSLAENHRATAAMVEACNAVFRQDTEQPFFTGAIGYATPVRPAQPTTNDRSAKEGASMVLVSLPAGLDIASARRVWATHIAKTTQRQLQAGTWQPNDIFVLTRTTAEGEEVAEALTSAGVPCLHLRREELFQSGEAIALGHVLRAISRPNDTGLRLRCLLTPFFGLTLAELEQAMLLSDTHPIIDFLFRMHELAKLGAFPLLFAHLFEETGIFSHWDEMAPPKAGAGRRQRAKTMRGPTSKQRLRDLHELLLMESSTSGGTLDDLIGLLDAGAAGAPLQISQPLPGALLSASGPGSTGLSDERAVRILTLHRAKGLEAKVVFLYGGNGRPPFAARSEGAPYLFSDSQADAKPLLYRGTPPDAQRQSMTARRNEEEQRLYYVGMTRAKERVYAPIYDALDERSYYAVLQRRLEALRSEHGRKQAQAGCPEIAVESIVHPSELGDAGAPAGNLGHAIAEGTTAQEGEGNAQVEPGVPIAIAPTGPPALFEANGHGHGSAPRQSHLLVDTTAIAVRSTGVTSYTKWKRGLEGLDRPTATLVSEPDRGDVISLDAFDLPGGAVTGRVLHEALERVPLETFVGVAGEPMGLDSWRTSPVVRKLVDRLLGRLLWPMPVGAADTGSSDASADLESNVAARYRDRIEHIVHAAFTTTFPITAQADGKTVCDPTILLPPLAKLAHPACGVITGSRRRSPLGGARDVPSTAGTSPAGISITRELEIVSLIGAATTPYVQGFIDVALEHEGRIFVLDWKSDAVDSQKRETVLAHTVLHHELQARFYALGVSRMLGFTEEAQYATRFAGVTFVYLRHLGGTNSNDTDRTIACTLKPSWASLLALGAELRRGQEAP